MTDVDVLAAAVRSAATNGITYDGLRIEESATGYTVTTGEVTQRIGRDELRQWIESNRASVGNWWFFTHRVLDERPFVVPYLRWLERADETTVLERYEDLTDGVSRLWGQLHIEVMRDGHDRVYTIVHEADVSRISTEELTEYRSPADATEIARFDADGRYRPLKTAPTLATGWIFQSVSALEAIGVLERFYPASIPNWYAKRQGTLSVTQYRSFAARQSGMYEVVHSLSEAGVRWTTMACCEDEVCIKRREWDLDDETIIDVPRGDGMIPCREPCSVFLEAARSFVSLAPATPHPIPDQPRSALVEVLAGVEPLCAGHGRAAAMDEPTNRYRLRFLRAMLADSVLRKQGVDPDRQQHNGDH